MSSLNPAVTLSVRVSPEIRDQLETLSDSTGRTKSFLAAEAIERYLSTQGWQVKAIESAVEKANSIDAKWVDHSDVVDWVNSWDVDNEQAAPE